MAFEVPRNLKPVVDFTIHVLVGSFAFGVLLAATALLSVFVKKLDGILPIQLETAAEYGEMGLFGIEMFLFALFSIAEAIRLIRELWREWSQ